MNLVYYEFDPIVNNSSSAKAYLFIEIYIKIVY